VGVGLKGGGWDCGLFPAWLAVWTAGLARREGGDDRWAGWMAAGENRGGFGFSPRPRRRVQEVDLLTTSRDSTVASRPASLRVPGQGGKLCGSICRSGLWLRVHGSRLEFLQGTALVSDGWSEKHCFIQRHQSGLPTAQPQPARSFQTAGSSGSSESTRFRRCFNMF
jgi:hypothetical protein